MRPFAYARAASLGDASAAAAEPGTAVLAGGTELLNWMRLGVAAPDGSSTSRASPGLDRIEELTRRRPADRRLVRAQRRRRRSNEWRAAGPAHEAIHKSASALWGSRTLHMLLTSGDR